MTTPFAHSTPELYDRYMGPLLFEPYAQLVAERCALLRTQRILETAAGTGIVTRAVHHVVPQAEIVATDLNPTMLDFAAQSLRSDLVTFQRANAQELPFEDGSFDVVLCQFGVMFFPDRVRAHQESRRVLRPDGHYILVSFDRLEMNAVPKAAGDAVASVFPGGAADYMARGPFCYTDPARMEQDLRSGGFTHVKIETIQLSSRVNARDAAQGLVFGSPLRAEIERVDATALTRAAEAVALALAPWDGKDAPMSAHVATARG